jgi:superfamily II DNA helicase RecQ
VEQLALMASFAEGRRCRMLSLVAHFGDQEDSGQACGLCDVCAPTDSTQSQLPPLPSAPLSARLGRDTPRSRKPAPGRRGKGSRRGKRSRRPTSRTPAVSLPTTGPSASLVAALRAWRLQQAKQLRVPAFRVLTNRALVAIAEARPGTTASLRAVTGVGPKLLQTYGAQIVALCDGSSRAPARARPPAARARS